MATRLTTFDDDDEIEDGDPLVHAPRRVRKVVDKLPEDVKAALERDWKSPPEPFSMDRCPTGEHGDEPRYDHRGETVWLSGAAGFGLQMLGGQINECQTRIAAAQALNRTSELKHLQGVMANLGAKMLEGMAACCCAWTATGRAGEPLPQPYKNPAAFEDMSQQEIGWLFNLVLTRTPDEDDAGKDGRSSRSPSSAKRPNRVA